MRAALRVVLILCGLLVATASIAQVSVQLGDYTIRVPVPEGMVALKNKSTEFWKFHAEGQTESGTRLLAFFTAPADARVLDKGEPRVIRRYAVVYVPLHWIDATFDDTQFDERVANVLQQRIAFYAQPDYAERISKGVDKDLGVLDRSRYFTTFGDVTRLEAPPPRKGVEFNDVATVLSTVHVGSKAVVAAIYALVESNDDIEWARRATAKWSARIASANQPKAKP
jgi:hypothetical protein